MDVTDMDVTGKNAVVTGGAGFVGSHLAERLLAENASVTVIDDLSNGKAEWVPNGATFIEDDLTDPAVAADAIVPETDIVFHFAAGKDVNDPNPRSQFGANTAMTLNVLERMVEVDVEAIAYTSSSTVYGEAPRPTPEDYPQRPISMYGTSKTAEEGLISTFVTAHDLTAWIYRFANIVGPRLQPGAVIVDFIQKLQADPTSLEILGDGRQEKSYMHIEECVDAMLYVIAHADQDFNLYNLGTETTTSVNRIADVVSETMGLDPEYKYTGGDRGWAGDVPKMRLSIEKLGALGWEPTDSSDDAVRRATAELVEEFGTETSN